MEPFSPMRRQFELIRELGFDYADLTDSHDSHDSHDGATLGTIPLENGVIGIESIVHALKAAGFDGATTLEVAGVEAVKTSAERLSQWEGTTA